MKRLLLCLLLLSQSAFAVREYYSLTRSIRSLGMGGAFYGLSDDAYALYYNPAGLDLYRGEGSWMMSLPALTAQMSPQVVSAIQTFTHTSGQNINSIISEIQQYQGQPLYLEDTPLSMYYVRKHFSIGLVVADTKTDLVLQGQDLTTQLDVTAISDTSLVAGYADTIFPGFHLGANAKVVGRVGGEKTFSLVDFEQGNKFTIDPKSLGGFGVGIDADVGGIYDLPWSPGLVSHVAFSINNILGSNLPIAQQGSRPPALPRMLSFGTSTVFSGFWLVDNVNFLLDIAEIGIGGESDPNFGGRGGSFWKHVNLGIELPMNVIYLRTGIHQGNWTAGFGVRTGGFDLEAATYGEELMAGVGRLTSRRYALQLRVGFGNASPPPLTPANLPASFHGAPAEQKERHETQPAPYTPPVPFPEDKKPAPETPAVEKSAIPEKTETPTGATTTSPAPTPSETAPQGDLQSVSPEPLAQPAPEAAPTASPAPATPKETPKVNQ